MSDIKKELHEKIKYADDVIAGYLPKEEGLQSVIMDAMSYSVLAGGKRLRPILLMEMALSFNGNAEDVKPFMAVMEFIHTYSLVHDDLPAMDDDDFRRGKKTTHKQYGEAIGVLAGDALLNYAFETGIRAALTFKDKERALKALSVIADKAGIYGMIGGQVVDVINDGKEKSKEVLDYINERKTAALIQASMAAGAILAGADDEQQKEIEKAGLDIGLAFQIRDDILDVTSTDAELGKPVHSDEKNNKSTYVNLMGTGKAEDEVRRLSENAIDRLKNMNIDNEFLFELIRKLAYRNK